MAAFYPMGRGESGMTSIVVFLVQIHEGFDDPGCGQRGRYRGKRGISGPAGCGNFADMAQNP
jgi:hypothetical protein